jgi:hypothetical protein
VDWSRQSPVVIGISSNTRQRMAIRRPMRRSSPAFRAGRFPSHG